MAEGEMFAGDADFMKNYVDHIRNASVDDVNAACSKYLNKSNSTTAILMPEAWNGSMGQDTKAEAKKADAPEVFTLDNGLRVIVNREAKIPMVSIVVLGEGGYLRA
jgi:predicted Zn-dependent peptidase